MSKHRRHPAASLVAFARAWLAMASGAKAD